MIVTVLGSVMELVPPACVRGMMAAIGIIIAAKQAHIMLRITPVAKSPIALLAELPNSVAKMNPEITIIAAATLDGIFLAERLRKGAALAVPLGFVFSIGPTAQLPVPANVLESPEFCSLK